MDINVLEGGVLSAAGLVGQRRTKKAANGRAETPEARRQTRASEKRNERLTASHLHCFID